MSLQTIKNQKGFTIVELLIVIVVIGILAAITIVAFNGVQNRAKSASGQSLASTVAKKAETYNTVQSAYPTAAQLTAATSAVKEAQLDTPSAVISLTAAPTSTTFNETLAAGGEKVAYRQVSATAGGCVYYWDYSASSGSELKSIKVGSASC